MEFTVKRSEKTLEKAVVVAEGKGQEKHARNLRSALAKKRAEKKTGRIEAAHKRWVTIKAKRAALVTVVDAEVELLSPCDGYGDFV